MDLLWSAVVGVIVFGALFVLIYWASQRQRTEPMVDDVEYLEPQSENEVDRPVRTMHDVPHTTAGAEWTRNRLDENERYRDRRPSERRA